MTMPEGAHQHDGPPPAPAAAPPAAQADVVLTVNGMVCSFCVQGVERTMRKIEAVQDVALSLEHKTISLWLKAGQTVEDDFLKERIKASGFDVESIARPTPVGE